MSDRSFGIASFKIHREETSIYWHGEQLKTLAHLLCNGSEDEGDRFVIFFLRNSMEIPNSEYLPQYHLGVKFEPIATIENYIALLNEEQQVFVHLDSSIHTNNKLSINKPVRQFLY